MAEEEAKQSSAPLLDFCPHCGMETASGFGLASGGYGPYVFCPDEVNCGKYFAKLQEEKS